MYNTQQHSSKLSNNAPAITATAVLPSAPLYTPLPHDKTASSASGAPLNDKQIQQLEAQGFTHSLAESINDVKKHFPLRIWVVDNSGSMHQDDGHRIIDRVTSAGDQSSVRMVPCTRWAEISSCVEYHMRLAALVEAPTRFRLLNPSRDPTIPSTFSIGERHYYDSPNDRSYEAEDAAEQFRRTEPHGATPLTKHIREIHAEIVEMAPALRRTGQRVCLVLATDGLPTDDYGSSGEVHRQRFVEALRNLEGLPVWVVIRLCTDDEDVVSFWNDIDAILELDIDVLDDFTAEAKEIEEFNPWINYALPLHRLREFGNHDRLYDLIDEREFTRSEARDFCSILFGKDSFDGVPDPNADWQSYLTHLSSITQQAGKVWNPLQRRPKKWVSVNRLRRGKSAARWLLCS